eukprot:6176326-Pleurochrysis_carterae.AAC.2
MHIDKDTSTEKNTDTDIDEANNRKTQARIHALKPKAHAHSRSPRTCAQRRVLWVLGEQRGGRKGIKSAHTGRRDAGVAIGGEKVKLHGCDDAPQGAEEEIREEVGKLTATAT